MGHTGARAGRRPRVPPALVTDLPVLAALVLCWLTISVAWAHLATGMALVGLIGVHLRPRWPQVRRRLGYWSFLAAAAGMTVTGLLRWAGVAAAHLARRGELPAARPGRDAPLVDPASPAPAARPAPAPTRRDEEGNSGMSTERFDTVVIGGGQAGMPVGYHLARQGRDFVIVDVGGAVGQAWRERWDSLRLFSPAHFTKLPGMTFPAASRHLPSTDEMADYLRAYAARFDLPLRLGWRVDQLSRDHDGYLIASAGRSLRASRVVVATGPALRPRVPQAADRLDPSVVSLHSVDYRNPDQLRDGPVLVVGAGNSGAEIALDVAPTHHVVLAGRDVGRLPISLGGPVYRVMNALLTVDTALGRRFMASTAGKGGTPLVRVRPEHLARAGVERAPRLADVVDGRPQLDDGRVLDVATVIWCTGYLPDYSWIALPGFPRTGLPAHHRGVVIDQPGLYLIGLPFLSRMASSLAGGVGADARHIADHLPAAAGTAP